MSKPRKINVFYTKLGREKAWGTSCGDFIIEIDERLRGKKKIEIMIHECLHELCPTLSEKEIIKNSAIIARTLWHEGIRPVDNNNDHELQDGKK